MVLQLIVTELTQYHLPNCSPLPKYAIVCAVILEIELECKCASPKRCTRHDRVTVFPLGLGLSYHTHVRLLLLLNWGPPAVPVAAFPSPSPDTHYRLPHSEVP